jgi:hypothetical protein
MNRIVNLVIIGLLLIGLAPLACSLPEPEPEFLTLEPGGLVTGVDGVTVGAPEGALDQPIEILIEEVDDPRAEVPFAEYLAGAEVVGDFYAISAEQDFSTSTEDYLILGLPVAENVSTDELALVCLVPPGCIMMDEPDDDPSLRWSCLQGLYDSESELFGTLLPSVLTEPQVFALIIGLHEQWTEDEGAEALSSADVTAWQTEPPGFYVFQQMGFGPNQCPKDHRVMTAKALNEARTAYVGMNFREPDLRRLAEVIKFRPPHADLADRYVYQLRFGNPNGGYEPTTRTAYTSYLGAPAQPDPITAHHELFHAIQFAYPAVDDNWYSLELHRTCEAAAVAAELSLTQLRRSNRPMLSGSRSPHPVDHGLWSSDNVTPYDYAAQDFLVYIGDCTGCQLGWMWPWFHDGGLEADLDNWLKGSVLKSLGNAYWEWVKNQAFEKQVRLGQDSLGNEVPWGLICCWSGHGNLTNVSFSPETWTWGPEATSFNLSRLTSKVFKLDLGPPTDCPRASYNVTANISTNDTHIKFKFYEDGERGFDGCWDTTRDNAAHTFQVGEGKNVTAYLLVSNTDRTPGASDPISLVAATTGVTNWNDLNAIRDNLGGTYCLINDLDPTTAGYEELASLEANGGSGWEPIQGFTGSFNGQGHQIKDLWINRPTEDFVGLFGGVGEGGVIMGVGVVNATVTGQMIVGALVGLNLGCVSKSYSSGAVNATISVVGGLIGKNFGDKAKVCRSYSTARVTGQSAVGGLVGVNLEYATVVNSYATGLVDGGSHVGGLVGYNGNTATVGKSYSTGPVTGSGVGGLVGANDGTVSDSFWDVETSGQPTSAGGTGKTTAEMKNIATFSGAGWSIIAVANPGTRNPSYIWNIVDAQTYPFLGWQP